ncbi:unnamed protein product [Pseudo-nitzschia multistriata]|uniref:Uncharacterized protein n=1 Tax=Pseudo-nitzschia multistriata TaxID=183589 RepID=A0A448Z932_9STRA|nr:unnamed protein product [Pseudo-nitzschia multistriata]
MQASMHDSKASRLLRSGAVFAAALLAAATATAMACAIACWNKDRMSLHGGHPFTTHPHHPQHHRPHPHPHPDPGPATPDPSRGRNGLPIDYVPEIRPTEYTLADDTIVYSFGGGTKKISSLYWSGQGGGKDGDIDRNRNSNKNNESIGHSESDLDSIEDLERVDPDARVIDLPWELTEELLSFCEGTGLMDLFRWAVSADYDDEYDDDEHEYESDALEPGGKESGLFHGAPYASVPPTKWAIRRANFGTDPSAVDLHWVDGIDEATFEETVSVLARGGFDAVLEAIATDFVPRGGGYAMAGLGFLVVSRSVASEVHADNPGGNSGLFNLLVPLVVPPPPLGAEFHLGSEASKKVAPLGLDPGVGLLLGSDTLHGTPDCDYRRQGGNGRGSTKSNGKRHTNAGYGMRVFASIYITDVREDNVGLVAGDGTALFPIPGQEGWLLAQRSRFSGGPGSFARDLGREPFHPTDADPQECPLLASRGWCEPGSEHHSRVVATPVEGRPLVVADLSGGDSPWEVRLACPKSCGVYLDDDTDYFDRFAVAREDYYREAFFA